MCIEIYQFTGKTEWESDCYIVSDMEVNNSCLIVDPGSADPTDYVGYMEHKGLVPDYMFITHRHYDHFAGANMIRHIFPFTKVVCSEGCNVAIQNPRLNCSIFMNTHQAIKMAPADIIVNGLFLLKWGNCDIEFVPTPGHTDDSISILIENNVFTGDALLKDIPTVTKLPSGNREKQTETEMFFLSLHGYKVWPGHGEAFVIK